MKAVEVIQTTCVLAFSTKPHSVRGFACVLGKTMKIEASVVNDRRTNKALAR